MQQLTSNSNFINKKLLEICRPPQDVTMLGIVYRAISTHMTDKSGLTKPVSQTDAVTLVQRIGNALNLTINGSDFDLVRVSRVITCSPAGFNSISVSS